VAVGAYPLTSAYVALILSTFYCKLEREGFVKFFVKKFVLFCEKKQNLGNKAQNVV